MTHEHRRSKDTYQLGSRLKIGTRCVGLGRLSESLFLFLSHHPRAPPAISYHAHIDGVDCLSSDSFARCFNAKAKLCGWGFQLIPYIYAPLSNTECKAPTKRCETRVYVPHGGTIDGAPLDDAGILTTRYRDFQPPDSPFCNSSTAILGQREKDIRR